MIRSMRLDGKAALQRSGLIGSMCKNGRGIAMLKNNIVYIHHVHICVLCMYAYCVCTGMSVRKCAHVCEHVYACIIRRYMCNHILNSLTTKYFCTKPLGVT